MFKTIIVLSDGTELSSGTGTQNAIISATVTELTNAGQELQLGSCCAAMLEAKLLTPSALTIGAGQELTVYRQDESGSRYLVGVFITEKPTCPSANTMTITAYDRITRLDRDLTQWLAQLTQWPYTLQELAGMVCKQCGVELIQTQLPGGSYSVSRFTAQGVTGRQLMQWIGEVAGRFCRATPEGMIEFAWYTPAPISLGIQPAYVAQASVSGTDLSIRADDAVITESGDDITLDSSYIQARDDGAGAVTLVISDALSQQYYFQNGLSFEDYVVAPIEKVQLRQSSEDVGAVYPDESGEKNTYIITANPLLTGAAEDLQAVAQRLYEQLSGVQYTPCKVRLPATAQICAGQILTVTDRNEKTMQVYVMEKTQNASLATLSCTGSARRDSTTAVNNQSYEALSGKVLNLRTDIDGIRAENADNAGKLARLELDVSGIRGQVENQQSTTEGMQTQLTSLEQTAEGISATVRSIVDDGVNKVTTSFGMRIDGSAVHISRSGTNMENKLNEKGMYILRDPGTGNETVMLRADADGVVATDVTVRNYLIVGEHARFEDYPDKRTACFWIGG